MKKPSYHRPLRGFTLVELLVVIAIIAVLAAAGFAVGPPMIDRAKRVTAQAIAVSISSGVEQFYSEYSALPDPGANSVDAEFSSTSPLGITLLEGLSGINSPQALVMNPKRLRCVSIKEAKNNKDGIAFGPNGNSITGLYDAWGQDFIMRLDYDYDERLEFTPQRNPAVALNGRRVAVWSLGVKNMADATPRKLVQSW